ncbi:MAG: hypothetical protein Q7S99_05300 [Parvibaculum sp.]|nr:hypothetical protein [Parvibaculum sp.]
MADELPATRVPGRSMLIDADGEKITAENPLSVAIVGSDVTLNVDDLDGVLIKATANAAPAAAVEGSDNSLSMDLERRTRVNAKPSSDQDPVFDHANGTKTSVTANATVLTPPTGCKYARISADVDILVSTDGVNAADDGKSIRISGGIAETIPVIAGTAVKALSLVGTAVVRVTPMKVRG